MRHISVLVSNTRRSEQFRSVGVTATMDAAARTLVIEESPLDTATGGVKSAPAARVVRV